MSLTHSLKSIHKILKVQKPSKVCLVTSLKLSKKLNWAIKEIGIKKSNIIIIPDGEKAKSWNELEKLLEKFLNLNLDRKSIVIAFGGGTVGDIVGFASSIYLRGIKYIQVPTTLLAQVDSSHGGKTAVDFLEYKNLIGSFYLPVSTIIDTRFMKSLSNEQVIDGLGEIIKAGLIKDTSILSFLKKYSIRTLVKSHDLPIIINKSIKVKEYFVKNDFKDNNIRQALNVGHTFGHAIELKYKISHGRAVLIGMIKELAFTESLWLTKPRVRENLLNLLKTLGIKIDQSMKVDLGMIIHDKKVVGKKIIFPIIESEGRAKLVYLDLNKFKSV
ncbi:MAG: 3-dehydroquinate synthase family protein [Candidatus Paceibacterota bacterium]|jgi:3-dehydroquinate synthase